VTSDAEGNADVSGLRAEDYRKLAALLREWTGIQLHGKQHLMSGRLRPRLQALGLTRYRDYFKLLDTQGPEGAEAQAFINALTTNKTAFFRESHHFDFLAQQLFPAARQRAAEGAPRRLRLWSAGCSRGAEPYSMALLAAAQLPAAQRWDVRILATDLDTDVLAEAVLGSYELDELADVPVALRQRWFIDDARGARVHPEVAGLVTFKRANLIATPFPVKGRFDAIFCRNVMIYFDRPTQERLVSELCKLLTPYGCLVVGHSESLLGQHMERVPDVVGVYRQPSARAARATGTRRSRRPGAIAGPPTPPPAAPDLAAHAAEQPQAVRAQAEHPARANAQHAAAHSRVAQHVAKPADDPRRSAATPRRAARGPARDLPLQRIVLGEWFTASEPSLVSTLLGSCVAACLYDPIAGIGGMNHFMLPHTHDAAGSGARFGLHAMEILINELMQKGADRRRLVAKVFGAAAVNRALTCTVAAQNGAFIRSFLARENIPLLVERLGGSVAREVYMRTDNGEAHVRTIAPSASRQLDQIELEAWRRASLPPPPEAPFNPDDALF
jgi:chemotaxis protein methyltransferase CheR